MLSLSGMLILLIIFAHFIVLITELLNSGIEAVVDMFTKEYHELAKKAKDLGSAAVLLSLANLTIVWGYAFYSIILK
ncbi:MAG: hypothetical protein ACD_79C01163G0001 [uncultured bacterium]|nr:MAG: hypothetical protein ACD_79C01163G0001 [uncultured bacterium]